MYLESFYDFIVFLIVVWGVVDFLKVGDYGVVLVYDYFWVEEGECEIVVVIVLVGQG